MPDPQAALASNGLRWSASAFWNTGRYTEGAQEAARAKGVHLDILKAGTESEIDAAFASLGQLHAGALIVAADPFFGGRRDLAVVSNNVLQGVGHKVPP